MHNSLRKWVVLVTLAGSFGAVLAQEGSARSGSADLATKHDSRVKITSPSEGSIFAPGDTFTVDVYVEESVNPTQLVVGMRPGVFRITGNRPFRIPVTIPENFVGRTEISAMALFGDHDEVLGKPLSVVVRPSVPPTRLYVDTFMALREPPAASSQHRIIVRGDFANGIRLDLSSADVGTSYESADTGIATVDANGFVNAANAGATYITSRHSNLVKFTSVRVTGKVPPPPVNVTTQVKVEKSEFEFDESIERFVQTLTVTNDNQFPIPGPLLLMLDLLPKAVNWTNHDGVTVFTPPRGANYSRLETADGVSLSPGESATLELQFQDPGSERISYTPHVIQVQTP